MTKYALVIDDIVDTVSLEPQSPPWIEVADVVFAGFHRSGDGWVAPSPPPPTVEEYQVAIQAMVDNAARSQLFNDGVTLASYVGSTVDAWQEQAKAFIAWRDNVWQYSYSELAKVQSGEREQPTVENFLLELPVIVWP